MSVTCEAGYPQTDRECAWCGASREQSCRRPPPDPRLAEINKLRAELAEARTVKESLIVSLDLLGRHSPKGKPCPVCEAIDAAMAGGENEIV